MVGFIHTLATLRQVAGLPESLTYRTLLEMKGLLIRRKNNDIPKV